MHMPAESRNVVAVGVIVIGLVVAGLAAFGDPRSWREPPSSVSNDKLGGIDPVEPVDPENPGPSLTEDDPESLEDPTNPFVTSIGGNFEHKVTIRVSADGVVQVGVYYRDGKQQEQVGVDSSFSTTRTFTGGYPLSMVMVTDSQEVSRACHPCDLHHLDRRAQGRQGHDHQAALPRTVRGLTSPVSRPQVNLRFGGP